MSREGKVKHSITASLRATEEMDDIQSIEQYAFAHCSSLEMNDVNQSADIHDKAFTDCNAMSSMIAFEGNE